MWWHCRCTGVRLMYTPVISIAVAFVLALVAPAHAGAPTDALKGHVDQVVKILSDPSLRDRPALECPHPGAAAGIREALLRDPRSLVSLEDRALSGGARAVRGRNDRWQ